MTRPTPRAKVRAKIMTDERAIVMPNWECIEWRGFYGEGWGTEIVPEAFAHPAKYSRALIRRIYQEMLDRGWLAEGDSVIDCFGGVALGGLDAMLAGLHWQGCELEPRFVALGQANIDLWNRRYAAQMPHWGTARIVQGDSRKLRSVLIAADASISSPPYVNQSNVGGDQWNGLSGNVPENTPSTRGKPGPKSHSQRDYGTTSGQLGDMPEGNADSVITSPPYASSDQDYKAGWARFHNGHEPRQAKDSQFEAEYGETPGQLGAMPEGVISSPPYADGARQEGTDRHPERMEGREHHPARYDLAVSSPPFLQTSGGTNVTSDSGPLADARLIDRHAAGNAAAEAYGADAGNLGNMREGDATVSSPPFENSLNNGKTGSVFTSPARADGTALGLGESYGKDYGETPGQAGSLQGDTFWSAARAIVAETFAVLRPGAHAAWVLKRFVRNGAIVEFPDQWRQLCESIGFKTVLWVHAMVVEDKGTQLAIDGNHKTHKVSRKSFFRRLHEKKHPGTEIDWEDVIFMVKPATLPLFASINRAEVEE